MNAGDRTDIMGGPDEQPRPSDADVMGGPNVQRGEKVMGSSNVDDVEDVEPTEDDTADPDPDT